MHSPDADHTSEYPNVADVFAAFSRCLTVQAATFDSARQAFQIVPRTLGTYPERSISYFHIRAACEAIQGVPLLEVGFANSAGTKHDNHLDALVFNDKIAILAEFKRAWTPRHWFDIAEDAVRIERFGPTITKRFKFGGKRRLFAAYGLDAWQSEVAEAWHTGTEYKNWKLPDKFRAMTRGYVEVWKEPEGRKPGTDYDGYYMLFAIEELDATW